MLDKLKKSGQEAAYNYSIVVLAQFLCIPLSILYLSLVTHKFATVQFGYYTIFLAASELFLCIIASPLRQVVLRFGSEDYIKGKGLSIIIGPQLIVISFSLAFTFLILFIFRATLSRILYLGNNSHLFLLAYLVAYILTDFTTWFLIAKHQTRAYAVSLLTRKILSLFLFWLVFVFLKKPYSVLNLIIIETISYLFILLIFSGFAFALKRLPSEPEKEKTDLKKILTYSWPVALRFFLGYLFIWSDIWIIKLFLDYRLVGQYGVVNRFSQYLINTLAPLTMIGLPLVVSFKTVGKEKIIREFAENVIPQVAFFWSMIVVFLICGARVIFKFIFGAEYLDSVTACQILLMGISFQILAYLFNSVLYAYDLTKELLKISLIAVTLNLLLDFMLIPLWGIEGAAVAKAVSIILSSLLCVRTGLAQLQSRKYNPSLFVILSLPILSLPVVLYKNDLLNLFLLIILSSANIFIAKQSIIFSKDSWLFWEKVRIPKLIMPVFKKIYFLLGHEF